MLQLPQYFCASVNILPKAVLVVVCMGTLPVELLRADTALLVRASRGWCLRRDTEGASASV